MPSEYKNSERYRREIITLLVAIAVLVVLQPVLWRIVWMTADRFQAARSQDVQTLQLRERTDRISDLYTTQRVALTQADSVVPPDKSLPILIERLERLARETGLAVTVTGITSGQPGTTAGEILSVTPVTLNVVVTGERSTLLQYLDAIEHMQELSVVTQWSLLPGGEASTGVAASPTPTPTVNFTLNLSAVFILKASDGNGS